MSNPVWSRDSEGHSYLSNASVNTNDNSNPTSSPSIPQLAKQKIFATSRIISSWGDKGVQFPPSPSFVRGRINSNDPSQGFSHGPGSVDSSSLTAVIETRDTEDLVGETAEPTTIAQRIHAMMPTLPPFPSPFLSTTRPKSPVLQQEEAGLPGSPPASPTTVVNDWKLLGFLSPRAANRSIEPDNQSILSALELLRSPRGKKREELSSPVGNTNPVLDCVDDNNSVMIYGPLEPDDTSEVEIACSEIVSVYEDGDEIRTPQARFVPLPTESIEQVLMGASDYPEASKGNENEPSNDSDSAQFNPPEEPWKSPLSKNGQLPEREYRVWVPSLTKISVQTMWWGFRIYLPPCVLDVLNNKQLQAAKRAAMITTALKWLMDHIPMPLLPPQMRPAVIILRQLVPYLGYVGGFIAWSWSAVKSFDKGYGVVLTATWLLPIALIPGTWEAGDFPTLNIGPQPTQTGSTSTSR